MTKEILLSLPEDEIIKYLEDKHFRICTDIDEELNVWYEWAKEVHGWSFVQCVDMIAPEEYMQENYNYIVLDDGFEYPKFWCGFNDLEELIDYFEDDLDFENEREER